MNLQKQIDAAAFSGGSRVTVPPGIHETGTLRLRNGVELYLEAGAELRGSEKPEDYPETSDGFIDGANQKRGRALICADGAENIALTGCGVVNGSGAAFSQASDKFDNRPFLLRFSMCRGVRLSGVELCDSPAWCVHLRDCSKVRVSGVTIRSRCNANNDGFDIDSCRDVEIRDCTVDSGDDAICLKTTLPKACEDIRILNCRLASDAGAIKFGTESYGDMRRVSIRDCRIERAELGAVKLLSVDGALLEDVNISGLEIVTAATPLFIRLGKRGRVYSTGAIRREAGAIRRITLSGVKGIIQLRKEGLFSTSAPSLSPLQISGLPGFPVEDMMLSDFDLVFPGGGTATYREVPENESAYPELGMFGELPASVVWLRHVRGLRTSGLALRLAQPDGRVPVYCSDVKKSITKFR